MQKNSIQMPHQETRDFSWKRPKSLFFLMLGGLLLASPATAKRSEELIIFTQKGADSHVSRQFVEEHLPALKNEASQLGIDLKIIDIGASGAPSEVHLTPLIVYQSPRGRAFFQGRYVDTGKVAHFIRTQRAIPPASGFVEAREAAVAELGRAKILAPIKITPLAGQAPEGHDAGAFEKAARAAIMAAFETFERRASATLGPSDRSFYMDFHPYRSADGGFYVSTALFSQFNCIEAVYAGFDEPTAGSWDFWPEVLGIAARQIEARALELIRSSSLGDGFDGVPSDVDAAPWEELGLELPEAVADAKLTNIDIELPTEWSLSSPASGDGAEESASPRLIFRFPPPLDRYSGEVSRISGMLNLGEEGNLDASTGFLTVETSSVTMGEKSLDKALRGKMIFVDRFPEARFDLESSTLDKRPEFGQISRMVAEGTFTMMGQEIPLEVRAQLEPIIGEEGAPRLHVQAGFELRLANPFGISGPDGPAPANDTLNFHLDVLLEDAQSSSAAKNSN